ncbi:phosphohistidine phosphatase SixA [Vibrio anguillarum]|jgi:phosphohistidine phosphatase|uniref:Phosphohistidine phosphatase SixA n=1 Tax=Vibrio anguillarum TaxID=55601 RepID=A0AAW4B074_VIBAN|nr:MULTISPECIES: phosphohistidine phosphatase SixA [Vibrio]NCO46356.1 phosphohistidine phosphatase SixA [Vibrio sp.]AEH32676.1 SixA [Vibrio anguillarum 775]AGU57236.1 phosphohistidine phosphatase [Vibrio anguillarum M3]ARV25525.1 phosphohistidine phosphatase SixA [Vibrio anguillarum]ASF92408.1 phosphohistidine phosphatase SixA [Vibrio anguillarum]
MKIFIMRHGEAEHYAASDAQRALTERGLRESVAVARACEKQDLRHVDKVLVSPYLRAQQTWAAIASYFNADDVVTCDDITPYGKAEVVFEYVSALADVEQIESVLLVSHLPLVGYLAAEFVTDLVPPMFPTSGLIGIEYDRELCKGQQIWSINP